jgi:acetyl esterase/lipase
MVCGSSLPSHASGLLNNTLDLAPVAQYPRQLQQAISLLSHTINTLKKKPSNIVLTGDSAGGNLALAVLSHLSHPHMSETVRIPPLQLEEKFRGVQLTSPWISFDTTTRSYTYNARKDTLSPISVQRWSKCFIGDSKPDFYNEPLSAPVSWWENIMAEEVLISASKDEVFVDGIVKFGNKLKSIKREAMVVTTEREPHNPPLLDLIMGKREDGETARLIKTWLNSKF